MSKKQSLRARYDRLANAVAAAAEVLQAVLDEIAIEDMDGLDTEDWEPISQATPAAIADMLGEAL